MPQLLHITRRCVRKSSNKSLAVAKTKGNCSSSRKMPIKSVKISNTFRWRAQACKYTVVCMCLYCLPFIFYVAHIWIRVCAHSCPFILWPLQDLFILQRKIAHILAELVYFTTLLFIPFIPCRTIDNLF